MGMARRLALRHNRPTRAASMHLPVETLDREKTEHLDPKRNVLHN